MPPGIVKSRYVGEANTRTPYDIQLARIIDVFEGMPPEVLRDFVDRHILAALDRRSGEQTTKILEGVTNAKSLCTGRPMLDLSKRRRTLSDLLAGFTNSTKLPVQQKLLRETLKIIASWLSDIWRVVCEFKAGFTEAHACLLYVMELLTEMSKEIRRRDISCDHHMVLAIANSAGATIKAFDVAGLHDVDDAVLWAWAELLTSLLATTSTRGVDKLVQDMLDDITEMLGWQSLQKVLIDIQDSTHPLNPVTSSSASQGRCQTADAPLLDSKTHRHQPSSYQLSDRAESRSQLRAAIQTHLVSRFSEFPSRDLFRYVMSLSEQSAETQDCLLAILDEVAPASSDTVAAALSIYAELQSSTSILALLESHGFLLRYSDYGPLQSAVTVLVRHAEHIPKVLRRIEREMDDIIRGSSAAVRRVFGLVGNPVQLRELHNILRLQKEPLQRRERINAWVSAVTTLHTSLDLAAIISLMGPAPETASFSDMNVPGTNPGSFSPITGFYLAERLEGWVSVARSLRGGKMVLSRAYSNILRDMPFLGSKDVTEEMLRRMPFQPASRGLRGALRALMTFCKDQQRERHSRRMLWRRLKEKRGALQQE
ncbi:hypothetical protein EV122DRAFT_219030 [Schizophyllum commune]